MVSLRQDTSSSMPVLEEKLGDPDHPLMGPERNGFAAHSPEWREDMILRYAGLVKYVAGRLTISLPPSLEWDDIVSYGTMGLIEAVDRFDESRGVKFETFAMTRIRGAIIDQLRALDWVPRLVRRRAREVEHAFVHMEEVLGRLPDNSEVAAHMGLTDKQYDKILLEASTSLTSLDNPVLLGDESGPTLLLEMIEDPRASSPLSSAERSELEFHLATAIQKLTERERLILALYYHEELTLKEVSAVLDVSESRACQLHARALLRLRTALATFADDTRGA